jgi:hypothetical protein
MNPTSLAPNQSPSLASASSVADVATAAANATAVLIDLATRLPIDDTLAPFELHHARVRSRIPLRALEIAADVLGDDPGRFPDFDADDARSAVTYARSMLPVAAQARALAASIERSVMKKRTRAGDQSLALYATLKGLARIEAHEKTRAQVRDLAAVLTTNRKSRETTVTGEEAEKLVRVARAKKRASLKEGVAKELAAEAEVATRRAEENATQSDAPRQPEE